MIATLKINAYTGVGAFYANWQYLVFMNTIYKNGNLQVIHKVSFDNSLFKEMFYNFVFFCLLTIVIFLVLEFFKPFTDAYMGIVS